MTYVRQIVIQYSVSFQSHPWTTSTSVPKCIISDRPNCLLDFSIRNINGKLINKWFLFEIYWANTDRFTGLESSERHIQRSYKTTTFQTISYARLFLLSFFILILVYFTLFSWFSYLNPGKFFAGIVEVVLFRVNFPTSLHSWFLILRTYSYVCLLQIFPFFS